MISLASHKDVRWVEKEAGVLGVPEHGRRLSTFPVCRSKTPRAAHEVHSF